MIPLIEVNITIIYLMQSTKPYGFSFFNKNNSRHRFSLEIIYFCKAESCSYFI